MNELSERDLVTRSVTSGSSILAFQWTVVATAVIAVVLRVYVRCLRDKNAGLDDLSIVVAAGLTLFAGVCASFYAHYGVGRHIWELTPRQVSGAIKWLVIYMLTTYIGLFFVRLSIGLFVLRILQKTRRTLRVVVYVAMGLNLLITVMVIIAVTIWCRPIRGMWDHNVKATCISGRTVDTVNRTFAAISAALDVLYTSLPIAIVWRLQLNLETKRNTTIILLLGLIACACAIGKAIQINESNRDYTYVNVPLSYWSMAEDTSGILVACLPALRQFFIVTRKDLIRLTAKASPDHDDDDDDFAGTHDKSAIYSTAARRPPSVFHASYAHARFGSLHSNPSAHLEVG